MLVAVTGFASIWRTRFRKDADDKERFARGAYFNTTRRDRQWQSAAAPAGAVESDVAKNPAIP
jgi:hypothetical protein